METEFMAFRWRSAGSTGLLLLAVSLLCTALLPGARSVSAAVGTWVSGGHFTTDGSCAVLNGETRHIVAGMVDGGHGERVVLADGAASAGAEWQRRGR